MLDFGQADTLNSLIPSETIAAYRATHYRVTAPEPFVLRIGERSAPLAAIYRDRRLNAAAFLTAWNPLGKLLPQPENDAAQQKLIAGIAAAGWASMTGAGIDPEQQWPGEQSILVLGIARSAAESFGREYQQNAIVWAGANATPELVLLR